MGKALLDQQPDPAPSVPHAKLRRSNVAYFTVAVRSWVGFMASLLLKLLVLNVFAET
jgi:hypothetical protein